MYVQKVLGTDLIRQSNEQSVSNLKISRRSVLGLVASVLALSSAKSLFAAAPGIDDQASTVSDNEIFVLVDGWVVPAKYFRA